MTITTLITINAILGAAVVYALLSLLAFGIRSDRRAHTAEDQALPERESWRKAA